MIDKLLYAGKGIDLFTLGVGASLTLGYMGYQYSQLSSVLEEINEKNKKEGKPLITKDELKHAQMIDNIMKM